MGVELDSLAGISQRMTQMGVIDNLSHPFHFMLESTFRKKLIPPVNATGNHSCMCPSDFITPHYDLFILYIVLLNFEILN